MSKKLIEAVQQVEKAKLAIPEIKYMYERGSYQYLAGTLVLGIEDPFEKTKFMCMNVEPIQGIESEIIREAQYLTSLMYVKHKSPSAHFYKQAQENIKEYERIHGQYELVSG